METPTIEWQRHHAHDKSHTDKDTRRITYRAKSAWETMLDREEIEEEHFKAAEKLYKHWVGSQGVRVGDDPVSDPIEYPSSYHAQMLINARREVKSKLIWSAIQMQMELDHLQVATEIGQLHRKCKDRKIARAHGIAMLTAGYELLAIHWGFKEAARC